MRFLLLLTALLLELPAHAAEPGRCDRIQAEFLELAKLQPRACPEATEVHGRYQSAFPEVSATCRRIEAQAQAGPFRLKLGTENEMLAEAMQQRKKDMEERATLTSRFAQEILLTPIDTDIPARPPAQVSAACRDELDQYSKARRVVLSTFSRLFHQIERNNETLFQQAVERAIRPPGAEAPGAPGR